MSKENYKVKPQIDTGISLSEKDISLVGLGGKKHPMLSALCNMLISALLVFGSVFTLSGMFSFNVNYIVLSAVLVISVFAFSAVFYLPKKYKRIAVLSLIGVLLLVCGLFYSTLFAGFYNIFLFGKDAVYNAMYWTKNYTVDFASLDGGATTFATCVIGVVLSLGVTFFNRDRVRFLLLMLITFPFFEIGAAFGCVPPYAAFSVLLAGWTATFAIFASSIVKSKKGTKKGKHKSSKAVGIGAAVAVITLLAFLGCNTLLTMGGYTRDNGTKDLRLAIKEGVSNIYDLITGEDHDASMKDGKLYKLSDREVKNRSYMTVTTSGKIDELYIKGFVGAKYTGNAFTEFDNYNEYKEMFDAFEKYNLYPQQMTGEALQSLVEEGKDGYIYSLQKNITIDNLRRKKDYAYTFDNAYFPDAFKYNYDLTARPSNKSKYSYTCFMDPTSYIKITNSNLYLTDEYQYLRGLYNEYVEKEYLQLPENNAYLKGMVDKITVDAYDDYAIADKIRYYLKDNTTYTEKTGEVPSGRDFVNYFLNENKKGYSAHYAATATLMLRAAGVPARYVEGFILRGDILQEAEENLKGDYVINVTDNEAHAWVEIYSKNYGWISVEVTPGFYSGHLGESSSGSSSEEFYVDENSDLITYVPPAEEPENTEVEETTKMEEFLAFLKKILPTVLKVLMLSIITVCSLILAALIILSIRLLIIKKIRKDKIGKGDKEAIITLYKYFNRLLLFEKIKNTEMMPYLRYAKYSAKQSRALTEENSVFLMNIFLKAAFSPSKTEQNEIISANVCIEEYKAALLKQLKFREKIVFIFIKALA